jgi:RNA polymerase-binding transcription factor
MVAGEGPPSDGLDLERIETELRTRLAGVREQIAELTRPPEQNTEVQFGKRVGDGTTEAITRFTDVGVANDLHAIEERIDRALDKLTEDSYGLCDECGVPIAPGRLRVVPESVLCLDCARSKR